MPDGQTHQSQSLISILLANEKRVLQIEDMVKFAFLSALLLAVALSCSTFDQNEGFETRAQKIDRSLICPVCPSETIDQSQVKLASQMRGIVREKLADGWSEAEVLDFFVDRYGERVLAAPPKSGFSLVAWFAPPFIIVCGLILLVYLVRSMISLGRRRVGPGYSDEGTIPAAIVPYLEQLDEQRPVTSQWDNERNTK